MELTEIQKRAVEELKKDFLPSIINLGMGSGKTRIVCEYLKGHLDKKVVILVPKSILLQWKGVLEEELEKEFDWKKKGICFTGGTIYVLSVNSIHLYPELFYDLNILIVDEPKLLKSESKVFTQLNKYLGGRKENLKFILLDATLLENSREELKCLETLLGVEDLTPFIFSPQISSPRKIIKKKILIPLPKHCEKSEWYLEKELLRAFPCGERKIQIAIGDLIRYLNSTLLNNPGHNKVSVIKKLILTRHKEDQGIIFCGTLNVQNELIKILRKEFGDDLVVAFNGDLKVNERQKIMDDFNDGKIKIIVSTKAGSRGIDLPAGKYVIHFDLPMGSGEFRQRDRVTRLSSAKNCSTVIYMVMIEGSVEEVQYSVLLDKIRMDNEVTGKEKSAGKRLGWKSFIERKHAISVAS